MQKLLSVDELFKDWHFDREIIVGAVTPRPDARLVFKVFHNATITIAGIELLH